MSKEKSPLKELIIDSKKPIYEVQIGDKKRIVNAKNMMVAMLKVAREHFGGIGVLMRARQMRIDKNQIKRAGSWHYISSKYIFKNRLKESNFPDF